MEEFYFSFIIEEPYHPQMKKKLESFFKKNSFKKDETEEGVAASLIKQFIQEQSLEQVKTYVMQYGVTLVMRSILKDSKPCIFSHHVADDKEFFELLLFRIILDNLE